MLAAYFSRPHKKLFGFMALILIIRVVLLFLQQRTFYVDEAQYWSWSEILRFGYHSKPPFIAWTIWLSRYVINDSEAAARCISCICYFITSIFIYLTAEKLYSQKVAIWSALTFYLAPGISYSSLIISTDPLLILFGSISIYLFILALNTQQYRYWLLMGMTIGLGMLSKYTAAIYLLSAFLILIVIDRYRHYLLKPHFYMMLIVSLAVISPNLIWNFQHHFVNFTEVLHNNMQVQTYSTNAISINHLINFLAAQLGVFGLIAFPLLLWVSINLYKLQKKLPHILLLLCFVLPLLIAVTIQALIHKANANWAAPIYITASIIISAWAIQFKREYLLKINFIINLFLLLVLSVALGNITRLNIHLPTLTWYNWKNALHTLQQKQIIPPHAAILVENRYALAEIIYYLPATWPQMYMYNPSDNYYLQYDTANKLTHSKTYYYISQSPNQALIQQFQDHTKLTAITTCFGKQTCLSLNVYKLTNFKGY